MNKTLKIIWNNIKIILGVCLICVTFYFGYNYLNKLFRTPDVDYGDSFHNMPENSVDVIVLGSSHAQYSFSPSFFYEDTGLYSYVLGSAFQPLKVSYQMLKEALKTQSPEMVVLEVYTACIDQESVGSDNRYTIALYQMTGDEKYNTIEFIEDEDKKSEYYNEFLNNHNNWKNLDNISELFDTHDGIDSMFGYIQNNIYLPVENYWYTNKYEDDLDIELKDEDINALNDIYNLCQEENIQLFLYMVPMDNVTQTAQSYRHKVWDWAQEHNVQYLDLIEKDEKMDIKSAVHHDGFHMYTNGASFVTDTLANYISENYLFNNHSENTELNEKYTTNLDYLTIDALRSECNAYKYMNRIVKFPYTVLVKYSGTEEDSTMTDYLNQMGINVDDGQSSHSILYNGQLLASSNNDLEYNLDGHDIKVSDSLIEFDDNTIECDELLTFIVIDKDFSNFSEKVVTYVNGYPWEYGYDWGYNSTN